MKSESWATERRDRCAFALVTALWWIAGLSTILTIAHSWSIHKLKWEAKIQEATDHFYLAEGILAQEVNRLKSKPWTQRWYKSSSPSISGTFGKAGYTAYVSDVVDLWGRTGKVLDGHTDLFLKVKYPVDQPNATSRSFFYRAIFRTPSPLRPTAVMARKFSETPEFDPGKDTDRNQVLAMINSEEILREKNRTESDVLVREIQYLVSRGVRLETIARTLSVPRRIAPRQENWAILARPGFAGTSSDEKERERNRMEADVFEREVRLLEKGDPPSDELVSKLLDTPQLNNQIDELETGVVKLLKDGRRYLFEPTYGPSPTAPEPDLAVQKFRSALALAAGAQDAANQAVTVPRCRFQLAGALRALGNQRPRGDAGRTAALNEARNIYESIVVSTTTTPGYPLSPEAPETYIPRSRIETEIVAATTWAEFLAANDLARGVLEKLRVDYPNYHLWSEEAITGTNHTSPKDAIPDDEVVYYCQGLFFDDEFDSYSGWNYLLSSVKDGTLAAAGGCLLATAYGSVSGWHVIMAEKPLLNPIPPGTDFVADAHFRCTVDSGLGYLNIKLVDDSTADWGIPVAQWAWNDSQGAAGYGDLIAGVDDGTTKYDRNIYCDGGGPGLCTGTGTRVPTIDAKISLKRLGNNYSLWLEGVQVGATISTSTTRTITKLRVHAGKYNGWAARDVQLDYIRIYRP